MEDFHPGSLGSLGSPERANFDGRRGGDDQGRGGQRFHQNYGRSQQQQPRRYHHHHRRQRRQAYDGPFSGVPRQQQQQQQPETSMFPDYFGSDSPFE